MSQKWPSALPKDAARLGDLGKRIFGPKSVFLKATLGLSRFGFFSPTRLAFGVLTVQIENRTVYLGVSGSPPHEPGSPDDPNLVPPMKKSQNNDPQIAQIESNMIL